MIPVIVIILITICISLFPRHSKAKTTKPTWKKQPSSLEIGKTYPYRIKHCSKKASIRFSSNHSSLASINRKTGQLRAKKPGKVVITAKIKQAKKKTIKLKTHIRIIKKKTAFVGKNNSSSLSTNVNKNKQKTDQSSILKHVNFSVAESINPWNHSIMLYSSRILLPSEVQDTNLQLTPPTIKSNPKTNPSLTAQFSSLSADGKTITYQLNKESRKTLCPGNGTSDGKYEITGNFFTNPLHTEYHERIHKNSLCGFVLNTNQTSLANVSVNLYISSQNTPIASTNTNSNGYYEFQNITEKNITLKAALENYDTYILTSLNPTETNLCQNIIMHPTSSKNLAVSCQILNKQNQAVKNTAVILTTKDADFISNSDTNTSSSNLPSKDKSKEFCLQGLVDANGFISFANQEIIDSKEYTQINCYSDQSSPKYLHAKMPVSESIIHDSFHRMTRNQDYVLYVFPSTDGSTIPKDYQMQTFSFSFDPLLSDSLFLQIHLQELPLLSAEKVSIHSDTLTNSVSGFHYILYDKKGNELFQSTLSPLTKDSENDYSRQLTTALQFDKIRLTDGDYYAAVTAFSSSSSAKSGLSDKEESVISGTTILSVQIQNNIISPVSFTLSPCQAFHALTFIDNCDENLENLSFKLYQKKDTLWFPIGTYTTDSFASLHSGQRAYLNLSVSSGTDYMLIPSSTKYQISSGNYFTAPEVQKKMISPSTADQENIVSSSTADQENIISSSIEDQENIISSQTPEHQILLNIVSDHEVVIKDTPDLSALLDYVNLCVSQANFDDSYFSNSATYPNTVYAYYQADGTFTNLLLATPSLSSVENISSAFIYDRLQNGRVILTSQATYSTTEFFVT